ncbi:MAG: ribose-5-phosphate isomerase RpiA [Aliifodinibius sp.]|nr:ribose-5-phosphate isomerase RpiA [Fodinibius sp.]
MDKKQISEMKKAAAVFAVEFIQSGMSVGLGTGSTAKYATEEIAQKLEYGELSDLFCVPSSEETKRLALSLNIKVYGFDTVKHLDINIDGADEVDINGNLIKGGGGALLREKILAQNSMKNIVIVDETKISEKLGEKWHLPIEVLPFCWQVEADYIEKLGADVNIRTGKDKEPLLTDQDNYILDCNFGIITHPQELSRQLEHRAGIVENGLFIDTTNDIVIGKPGGVDHKQIKR